jgi:hypothetical protein
MVAPEDGDQRVCDSLWQKDRHAGADTYDLDMGNSAEATQHAFQKAIGKQERVTAGEQHVAHFFVGGYVVNDAVELTGAQVPSIHAYTSSPSAVAAIGGAPVGRKYQHSIGIAVHQARNWRVMVFRERVTQGTFFHDKLGCRRHYLSPNGAVGIRGIH